MPKAFRLIRFHKQRAAKRTIPLLPVLLSLCWFVPALNASPILSDTLRILALRVEFVVDNLATTTGDGKFELATSTQYKIDRPPHNRTYFQHQLLALNNYFNRVSQGQVHMPGDVYPLDENRAYPLPQNMLYYSGQENKEMQKMRWSELLRDALKTAEKEGGIDFKRYSSFIVFHAGVGSDFAFDFDTTPYDIQSVYLDFETLQQTLGNKDSGFKGIEVGGTMITNGLVLPETQNQEGLDLGLLGTMTLLMGSRLGMPTLFDSQSGRTGIGRWGLMDQGSYNFQGLIPAEPSAWEKVHMGWETPVLVRQGDNIRIGSSTTQSAPHIIKVPIDAKEYYLIENRVRDRNHDKITLGRDELGNRVQFDSTGRVVGSGEFGVITRVDEYDFGLPGEGILIWHIDERIIDKQLAKNTINDDRLHRGVDLEECDGAQDIGYVYGMFDAGSGTENGDYFDAYWNDNESHKIINASQQVVFSPLSVPNSNAYNGAVTHITMDQFSTRDTVMTIRVRSDLAQNGFPISVSGCIGKAGLLSIDLGPGQGTAIAAAGRDGRIWGWHGDGRPLQQNNNALFAATSDSIDQPIAACGPSAYGAARIIAADRSGKIYAWLQNSESGWTAFSRDSLSVVTAGPMILTDESSHDVFVVTGHQDGMCHLYTYKPDGPTGSTKDHGWNVSSAAITGLAQFANDGSSFLIATETGLLACYSTDAKLLWQRQLSPGRHAWQPVVANFSAAPGMKIAVLSDAGECWMLDAAGNGNRIATWLPPLSEPAAGDMDGDGWPEILLSNGGQLFVYESTGAATLNFPFTLAPQQSVAPISPLWMEAASAPKNWAFVPGAMGLIWGVTPAGHSQSGYPLTAGGEILTTPVLQDLDQDGDAELLVIGEDQQLYAWSLPMSMHNNSWPQWGANSSRTFLLKGGFSSTPVARDIMPVKKVFCYPNPTQQNTTFIRYTLTHNVETVSIRIFDMAGDLVQELASPPLQSGDHEVVWKVDSIDSGVYIARVQARAGKDNSVAFIKIAVVK